MTHRNLWGSPVVLLKEQNDKQKRRIGKLVFLEGRHPEGYVPSEDIDWIKLAERSDVALDTGAAASEASTVATMSGDKVADAKLLDELGAFQVIIQDGAIVGQHFVDGPAAGLARPLSMA